ncbi:MAG: sigma-70 family RNA polymerase sigma factor [Bacillota bacterium]
MCACSSGLPPIKSKRAPADRLPVRPEEHEKLAVAVARRFRAFPVEFDDLLQAARLGLVEAAARFDPSAGVSFATCAVPIMLGQLRRLVEKSRAVSGVRGAAELLRAAEECRRRFQADRGRDATLTELAAMMGVDAAELAAAVGAMAAPVPLEETPLSPAAPPGEAEHWADTLDVRRALGRLPDELRRIVYLRFFQGLRQREVAQLLGLSQPVVSRREREALAHLRRDLEAPATSSQP